MSEAVPPGYDSAVDGHVVLRRYDQWLDTIVGEEILGGATHYRVQWEPTFEPDSNMVDMGSCSGNGN
ncbi:hypothetical protein PG995_009049 [Apiospora arundinis]